jgi:hypothetical protein
VPWALIGGYGTRDEFGIQSYVTGVKSEDFALVAFGASANIKNRLEISLGRQNFHLRDVGKALGLGNDFIISQTIIGAKVRLIGDAVLDQNTLVPQISVGVQHKINDDKTVVGGALGLRRSSTDFYIAATKLFLDKNLLVNTTVRLTKANQYGILGFGGLGGRTRPTSRPSKPRRLICLPASWPSAPKCAPNQTACKARWADSLPRGRRLRHLWRLCPGPQPVADGGVRRSWPYRAQNQHAAYLSLQVGF